MSQTPIKEQPQEPVDIQETPEEGRQRPRVLVIALLVVSVLVLVLGGVMSFVSKSAVAPAPSSQSNTSPSVLSAPQLPSGTGVPKAVNMGMPGAPTSITSLQAPLTAPAMKEFTLVAQDGVISLDAGMRISAWTFNGVTPGPQLRVQQGDLVVVTVVNHLSFGITIHWHGIDSFNSADGVAGVTQDAIKPGQSYIYRFFTPDAGTYWYHAHQLAYAETVGGLFGTLVVDPKTPTIHADVDDTVALHAWNGPNDQSIFSIDDSTQTLSKVATPGQWVRLRIVETSNTDSTIPHLVTLVGTPFKVVSLDGHDLNGPQWLTTVPVPIGTAQRVDLLFQMPANGAVALVTADEATSQHYQRTPAVLFGQGTLPATLPAVTKWFDLTTYGMPTHDTITLQSHFDITYGIVLNNQIGTSLGRMGMTYTMNGKVFPDTAMLMVKYGQLVRIHLDNQSDLYHPIHLHGHIFTVLTRNGQPLQGSPIHLDTVLVPPHTIYDIAFIANNPGIWMIHCHNFLHANWGMDMMLMYYGYSTPYTVGTDTGNFPD